MADNGILAPRVRKLASPNIGWRKFFLYVIFYVALTAAVAMAVFFGVEYGEGIKDPFGTEALIYSLAAGGAFVAYKIQHAMARAYAGGRLLDFLVSLPMLVVTASALLLWSDFFPPVTAGVKAAIEWVSMKIGYPPDLTASTYTVLVDLLFLVVAAWDVGLRDLIGVGRGATGKTGSLPARLKVDEIVVDIPPVWHAKLPNGRKVPFTPSEEMLAQLEQKMRAGTPTLGVPS